MKFLCDQCKAKYQISDDKVAGKTVRMKCRKCGHVIELRAEVTESSVIAHAPVATSPSPADGSARPQAPRPPARPPPRPNALATSLTSTKPAPPRTSHSTSGGALAGAFKTNVQREEESSTPFDMADLAPGDDWYVAVNGVPVGPIRIAEVRRKAALGAVTEDSLVWQEGLDEWRPLKTFPDLAANVREAAAGGRISITPPPPDVMRPSSPPPPRSPSMRSGGAGVLPSRVGSSRPVQVSTPAPAARSNVVPITSRLATAERLDDAPTEIGAFHPIPSAAPDPFALAGLTAAAPSALAPPVVDRGVGVLVGAAAAPASIAPGPPSVSNNRKQPPWGVYVLLVGVVLFAVTFGVVAATSIFNKPPAPVAAAPTALPPPPPTATQPAATAATTAPEPTASVAPAPASHGGPIAQAGTHVAPASTGKTIDLGGLAGNRVALPGEETNDAPAAAGQCLSSGQVQQVIQNHQISVRRACWERNPTTKPSVNVSVSMTVGADGSAQGVTATSNDDTSVANCIQTEVRTWRFPSMGCSQKTGFSFKFVRQ
ncbi:MAG TPA: GYF domain-containing protein [Polyangiaceae bacterium]|nr:GYF domain-containing protein [Polyangiaceae bacterium]